MSLIPSFRSLGGAAILSLSALHQSAFAEEHEFELPPEEPPPVVVYIPPPTPGIIEPNNPVPESDLDALASALFSGIPLTAAQCQILASLSETVLMDVNARLFRLRAGGNGSPGGSPGPTGKDIKDVQAPVEDTYYKWEIFAGGDYGYFDLDANGRQAGFDSDTWVATIGAEYRINRTFTVGLAGAYVNSSADLNGKIGSVDTEGGAVSAYGSAVFGNLYLDLLYSYGAYELDIRRNTFTDRTAHGDTEARTHAIQFNTGYNLQLGGLRTGPLASAEWIHGELEGYRETGGGTAALDFPGQSYDSLISRLGWQASYTAKTSFGAITPQVRASWDHEYLDSADSVSASLLATPFTTITGSKVTKGDKFTATAATAQPGRDYLNLGAGLSAQFGDRISATLQYETHLFQAAASAHLASVRISVAF